MKLQQLLVVLDPGQTEQPALQRATWMARQSQARLHLLLVEYHGNMESILVDSGLQKRTREALLNNRRQWLEELAEPLRREGLTVTVEACWAKSLHKQVLLKAEELSADVLFKSAGHRSLLRRLFLTDTSWQLIRHCPIPLWLTRHSNWQAQNICAALDPVHASDKPAHLDHLLIEATQQLGQYFAAPPYYLHSYAPLPKGLVFDPDLLNDYDAYVLRTKQKHQDVFEKLLAEYAVPVAQQHILEGFAEDTIPEFVQEQDIDLLVMGAIARGNLESAVIGHTADRVLQHVECDLLVVRP